MLIIDVKHNESISQALKRYKRKYRSTKVIKELRGRKEYIKPTTRKRKQKLKAAYKNEKMRDMMA